MRPPQMLRVMLLCCEGAQAHVWTPAFFNFLFVHFLAFVLFLTFTLLLLIFMLLLLAFASLLVAFLPLLLAIALCFLIFTLLFLVLEFWELLWIFNKYYFLGYLKIWGSNFDFFKKKFLDKVNFWNGITGPIRVHNISIWSQYVLISCLF